MYRHLYQRTTVAIVAILILAFGLRVWGLAWGMPFAFHADEDNYLPGAIGMLFKGDLNPHYFRNPPLLTYAVLLELLAYLKVGQIIGFPKSINDLGTMMAQDPTPLYLLARMNGAIMGTATVVVAYLAAKRLFGARAGLAGALLLATAFLHVRDSHYAVNDVPATFFLMLSFYFATMIYRSDFDPTPQSTLGMGKGVTGKESNGEQKLISPLTASRRVEMGFKFRPIIPYILSGAFLGLAVATKYNVGLGAVAILVAHLLACNKSGWGLRLKTHAPLLLAGAASLISFLMANPFALLDYKTFIYHFLGQYTWTSDPYDTSDLPMGRTILRALSVGTSPWILAASLLGLIILIYKRPQKGLLVGAFPFTYLAFFLFGSRLFFARFAIPVVPFVAILSGYALTSLVEAIPSLGWQWVGGFAAAALLVTPPLFVDAKHNVLLRTEDTRLQLARWVETNVPPGSKIAVEGYSLVDFWGRKLGFKKLEYSWDVSSSLRSKPLEYYRQEHFNYLVASSYVYGRYHLDVQAHAEAIDYYQQLERQLPLVIAFHPTAEGRELPFIMDDEITPIWTVLERDRPGPTLKVYRVGEPQRYEVEWLEAETPKDVLAGEKFTLQITLENVGNLTWPSDGYSPVRIGYRWLDRSGQHLPGLDLHTSIPWSIKPGEHATVQVDIVAPKIPGTYTLQLDLVQENFSWLSAKGAKVREFSIMVK